MDYNDALAFLSSNFDAVVNTFRKSGAIQSSVVKAGAYQNGVVFVAIGNSAKLKNLARDPRCTVTVVSSSLEQMVCRRRQGGHSRLG